MPLYVVQAGDGGPCKIGISKNIRARMVTMQVHHHAPLRLIGLFDGDRAEERALHERFAEHRIAGEWFNPHPEIVAGAFGLPLIERPRALRRLVGDAAGGGNDALTRCGLSDAEIARRLRVSAEAIRLWRAGKRRVCAERAVQIEREFGIPRHVLRPDLWPRQERSVA